MNFEVALIPRGRELLYPGVANVIGNSLRELNLEDVEKADSTPPPDKPVQVEFRTFDGLIVRVVGAKRGDDAWVSFTASVDADQVARNQAAAKAPQPAAAGADATKPESGKPGDSAAQADGAAKPAEGAKAAEAAPADPTAEAQRINAHVMAWRFKLATFQYDQMTRRMADLLKPAG
jgi:hypothetical protein